MRLYHVYILASTRRRLYVGVTGNLVRRLWQHRNGRSIHTARYRIDQLVLFEEYRDAVTAIAREKKLKSWRRERKERLVTATNPEWRDLAIDWLEPRNDPSPVDPGCTAWRSRRS